ncbi:MAG: ABC transporter permease [Lachnospiraceae bacterium]|nr:ABC transporter permease [Lachnospiraceae bacterium]
MRRKLQSIINSVPAVMAIISLIFLWHYLSVNNVVPSYMLPKPMDVFNVLIEEKDILFEHALITLQEAFWGLGIGIGLGFVIATIMDEWDFLYKAIYPIMVITQTIPTIAIAPLLVLWMGFGMEPKITLVVLTTFFPIAVGLLDGYKSVDKDEVNLLRSMGAGKFKIFKYVKLPNALPHFFSGLKISASYAIVGAVISEWLGGFEGLGVYMTRVKKAYAFDRMFAVIIVIVAISLLLMKLVNILRKMVMPWECKTQNK